MNIEKRLRRKNSKNEYELEENEFESNEVDAPVEIYENNINQKIYLESKSINGYANNHSTVISREDFILLPEPTIKHDFNINEIKSGNGNETTEKAVIIIFSFNQSVLMSIS